MELLCSDAAVVTASVEHSISLWVLYSGELLVYPA